MKQKQEISEEDIQEYHMLKRKYEKEIGEGKVEFENIKYIGLPEGFSILPKSKEEQLDKQAKIEVTQANMTYKLQNILKLNAPDKEKKIDELKINLRNFTRQKRAVELNLSNKSIQREKCGKCGSYLHGDQYFQAKFNVEKLEVEIGVIQKELILYGIDPAEVIKGI